MKQQSAVASDGPYSVRITATCPNDLQDWLDRAEAEAIAHARIDGARGVLVTRLARTHFAVEVSDNVPYGTTSERDIS
jgi:hypothetical protein